ncbi:hypothetical protein [Apibacter adventoris]|uniref:hypothetical protein n=1 Tax=Apibacter adventoris TaxID=1679466 RepID=UPI000CF60339|nr:hypothetical protein [Apibacter adventoris]PQL94363.1 hypothetical protein C4S76_05690 [Apibacter adventoris]
MNRDNFMRFFRDDNMLNSLSVDDRIEIFSTILLGKTDITFELLNNLLIEYDVEDLEIKKEKKWKNGQEIKR